MQSSTINKTRRASALQVTIMCLIGLSAFASVGAVHCFAQDGPQCFGAEHILDGQHCGGYTVTLRRSVPDFNDHGTTYFQENPFQLPSGYNYPISDYQSLPYNVYAGASGAFLNCPEGGTFTIGGDDACNITSYVYATFDWADPDRTQPPSVVLVKETAQAYVNDTEASPWLPNVVDDGFKDQPVDASGVEAHRLVSSGIHYTVFPNPGLHFEMPIRVMRANVTGPRAQSQNTGAGLNYAAEVDVCDGHLHLNATAMPDAILVGKSTTLTAVVGNCADTSISTYTYNWDFADGSTETTTSPSVQHTYSATGSYNVTVTLNDGTNATVLVTVENADCHCNHGNRSETANDPVPTRGLPLGYSIVVNTQVAEPNRTLGNATFTYDMHIGRTLVSYDVSGNPVYDRTVVDGSGGRYDFGPASSAPVPSAGIDSHLSVDSSGYHLTNAGSPDSIGSAGNYKYDFDVNGNLSDIVDPNGNVQALEYDSNGILSSVTDLSTGKSITFGNDGTNITTITQGGGAEVTWLIYDQNELSQILIKDSTGTTLSSKKYLYGTDGFLLVASDNGDPTTSRYYTYSKLPSKAGSALSDLLTQGGTPTVPVSEPLTSPVANVASLNSNVKVQYGIEPSAGAAQAIVKTNSLGFTGTYNFDEHGDLLNMLGTPYTGATAPVTRTIQYDSDLNPTYISDGTASTSIGYGDNGMQTSVTDALNHTWYSAWSGVDLISAQDPVQHTANVSNTITYNDPAQPHVATSTTDAIGNTWQFGHNSYGQLTTVSPPAGSATGTSSIAYDSNGMPASVIDPDGNVTLFNSYDTLGDLLSRTEYPAAGVPVTSTTAYTADQHPLSVTRPDGKSVQFHYTNGSLDTFTDYNGNQKTFTYTGPDQKLTSINSPLGLSLNFSYDTEGNLAFLQDAMGNLTTYTYGPNCELTGVLYPDGATANLAYNSSGNVRETTNGRGQKVDLHYDAAERLAEIDHTTSGQPSEALTYYNNDAVHTVTDGAGATTFEYLLNGWLSSATYDYSASGLSAAQTVSYTYYPDGLVHTMTWPAAGTWTYAYDATGQVVSVSNPWGETTHYAYDGLHRIRVQNNANGTKTRWCFDNGNGFLTAITHSAGSAPLASYNLTYDNGSNTVGMLTGVSESDGSSASYAYDSLYRLRSETRTGSASESNNYSYDLAGNLTGYQYDAANKRTDESFDGDGDQTSFAGHTLSWDDGGNLISAGSDIYSYSGGARVEATDTNGQTIYFIYGGGYLLGAVHADGSLAAGYTWGPTGLVSERLPSLDASRWYHFGPQFETRYLTDETGNPVDTYVYNAYGVPVASYGTDPNPYRYGGAFGYYTDRDTSLILCGTRWYDPSSTRWLSQDPAGYGGGFNLYAYCDDDPVTEVDPSGASGLSDGDCWSIVTTGWIYGDLGSDIRENRIWAAKGNAQMTKVTAQRIGTNIFVGGMLGVVTHAYFGTLGATRGSAPFLGYTNDEFGNSLSFSQTTARSAFSGEGAFAGQTIGQVADGLRTGAITPSQVPVDYVVVNGNRLIVNTRSSLALTRAGIPQSEWSLKNATLDSSPAAGEPCPLDNIKQRLERNKLTNEGTKFIRITPSAPSTSSLK